jgi:hypothetical protein
MIAEPLASFVRHQSQFLDYFEFGKIVLAGKRHVWYVDIYRIEIRYEKYKD